MRRRDTPISPELWPPPPPFFSSLSESSWSPDAAKPEAVLCDASHELKLKAVALDSTLV